MTVVNDGITSLLTSLGKKSDSREYKRGRSLSPGYLWTLFESSWLVRKYITKTAEDMTKVWREIKAGDLTTDEQAEFSKIEKKLSVKETAQEALAWGSLFGDTIVLAITDATSEKYELPLDLKREVIRHFLVFDRTAYTVGDLEKDITAENFGFPTHYIINGDLKVHYTRLHRIIASKQRTANKTREKYGSSDINPIYDAIKMFDSVTKSIDDLVEESNVDVLLVEGLNAQIAAGKEEDVLKYALLAKQSKSSANILLIDKSDGFDQKQVNFGGLADIWVKAANVVAGALDRPITVLFGQSASGFNSGEEDNKNYYDTITGLQESRLRPLLNFIDKFIFDEIGKEPLDWEYEFPTIDSMNKKDMAAIFASYVTPLAALVTSAIITEEQALRELKLKGLFESISNKDIQKAKALYESGENSGEPGQNRTAQALIEAYQAEQANRGLVP